MRGCMRLPWLLLAVLYILGRRISAMNQNSAGNGFESIHNPVSKKWDGILIPKAHISSDQSSFLTYLSHTADDGETLASYQQQETHRYNSIDNRIESRPERSQNSPPLDMKVGDIYYEDTIIHDNTPSLEQNIPLPTEFLFYLNSNHEIFGPFPYQQIVEWFYAGHFSDSLLVSQDPQLYSFSPLRDFLFAFDPYYSQQQQQQEQQQQLYQHHFHTSYYSQDHFRQSPFLKKVKKTSSQLSNWISSKASQSTSTLALQNTAAHVSSLLQESSERMKKVLEWSNMKQKASRLIPMHLKTLFPLNTRSRYQDAHLDALWSKRNRQKQKTTSPQMQPIIDASSVLETQSILINEETNQENVGMGELFQFSKESNSEEKGEDLAFLSQENDTVDKNISAIIEDEKSIFSDSFRINNNINNKVHNYNDNFFSSTINSPKKSRTLLKSLSSFLPSLFKTGSKTNGKANIGEDSVLHLWDMTDRHPTLGSSLSSTYSTPTTSHTAILSKQLFLSLIFLVQAVSWVVLFHGIVTEVDWVIWTSRYEDVLHRLLVVDFLDPAVYRYLIEVVFDKVRKGLESPGDNIRMMIELWTETVRSWFVHTDNMAMLGVVVSTVIMSVMNSSLWPNVSFLSVFGLLILCLRTKVLSSLELTAGVAAWTVRGGISAVNIATPGQVLILRIVSVMQQMKLLWCTMLLTASIHYLKKSNN